MPSISAVIITHNEERNIARCLQSLEGVADEIVVVDSGSTDRTEQICAQYDSQPIHFQFHEWEGYAGQKNYANSIARHPWILSIDADEALSDTLRESILQLKDALSDTNTLYCFNRLTNYCGHWIRHCGWYPDTCTRLFHRDAVHWDGHVHEELRHNNPQSSESSARTPGLNTQFLPGDLLHYSYYSVGEHAERTVRYALMAAQKAYDEGKRAKKGSTLFKPLWTFVRNYFFRLGFLDGHAGFVVCKISATYTFLKYAKLKELSCDS